MSWGSGEERVSRNSLPHGRGDKATHAVFGGEQVTPPVGGLAMLRLALVMESKPFTGLLSGVHQIDLTMSAALESKLVEPSVGNRSQGTFPLSIERQPPTYRPCPNTTTPPGPPKLRSK